MDLIVLKCKHCGKEFKRHASWAKKSKSLFCSKKCYYLAMKTIPLTKCETCGKKIEDDRFRKFCSLKCAYGHRQSDKLTGKINICKSCGGKFYRMPMKKSIYCSEKCRRIDMWEKKRIYKKCKACGKGMYGLPSYNPEFCSFECYRKAANNRTRLESQFAQALTQNKINFREQVRIGRRCVDFLIGNLVVEVDGDYWHGTTKAKESDQRKDTMLRARGYSIIRIKESEWKIAPNACIKRVTGRIFS